MFACPDNSPGSLDVLKLGSIFGKAKSVLDYDNAVEVNLNGLAVSVTLIRSKRARRIRLRVAESNVTVTVPYRVSRLEAEKALHHHACWITKHVLNQREHIQGHSGNQILYGGQTFLVEHLPSDREGVLVVDSHFRVYGKSPEEQLESWLRSQASEVVGSAMQVWSDRMGLAPARVQLRDQKTKWGSCSSRGTVTINWRLIMAPREVLEYVVIHELAHLKELNHSPRFWELVAKYCPDHKEHKAWLRKNGSRLHIPKLSDND